MHWIHFALYSLLPLALASQVSDDFVCSTWATKNLSFCKKKAEPYCPGYEASTALQSEIFADFIETLYGERNVSKAFETYVASDIIEHDPVDSQDRDAIVARLAALIPYVNSTILFSSFGDNIGLVYLKVEDKPEPIALADIYRMNGTCIVEHWDINQARPANTTNPLAMF
ncbi:hypothetical protein N7486_007304 [Penicillium sp. IBT 16267x]|nr:hypothetical protein N7486_007304 [Penicillium sp. IBT 16267x]